MINPETTNVSLDEITSTAEANMSESQQEDGIVDLGNMLRDDSLVDVENMLKDDSLADIGNMLRDDSLVDLGNKLKDDSLPDETQTETSVTEMIETKAENPTETPVVVHTDMSGKDIIGETAAAMEKHNEETTESAENRQDDLEEWSWMDKKKKQQLANMESQMLDEYTQSIIKNGLRPMFEFSFFQEDIKQAAAELEQIKVT